MALRRIRRSISACPTPPRGSETPSSTRSSRTDSRAARGSPKPGPLEPWDAPPTNYGFKGGDLLGIVEHLDHIESLGRERAVPDAGLPVGVEPPLPHVRLPDGRPAARRRRRAPRAPRRGARAGHAGRSSTASSTTPVAGSGRSTTCSRRAAARRTGTGSTSTRPASTGTSRSTPIRSAGSAPASPQDEPWPGTADADAVTAKRPARLRGVVGHPGAAEAQHRRAGGARVPVGRRGALAPLRHRRLAPGRPGGDRRSRRSGPSSGAAAGRSTPRRTSWARSGTSRPSGSRATASTR